MIAAKPIEGFCIVCGNGLTGRQRKLCSDECRREQKKEYARVYRQDHKERKKEYAHKHRLKNLGKYKAREHEYRLNHREEYNELARKYYRRNHGLPEDWDLSKASNLEIIMKQWFHGLNIGFVEQHYINLKGWGGTRTWVDFFIEPNICFYSDGDYYHGPKRHNAQERDIRINRALETGGYIVIRLSESDILTGVRPIEILELIQ